MGYLKRNVLIDYKKSFVTQNGQYDKQDNLVLMIRPGPTDIPGDSAVDISKNSHTVTYGRHNAAQDPVQNDIDTPFSLSPVSFNPDSFNCRSRSDLTYINVADANDLSFDDNPGASPFSISLWFKGNPQKDGHWSYLMGKDGEYRIKESTLGGVLQVHLLTTTANYVYLNSTTSGLVSDGKWHHMVVTYNGTSASREIAVYIDGALESSGVGSLAGSGYSGMTAGSGDLRWGSYSTSGNTHCGKVSEMGIWNVVLSAPDVKAIYEATQGVYRSGIISNPARIMLQDRDNRTGSYPTISRTGDPDFTGRFASTFDDTNTIIFDVGQKLYPTNLPAGSKFVSGGVASPNVLQGLTAIGTSSVGVADSHVSFTPGENISPFTDSRLYIDNNSSFFATGTASETLPGFSQRLGSKTAIEIDINPAASTDVMLSTGTLPNASGYAAGVNSGMAYFNFVSKKWEVIGNLTTGSNVDVFNATANTRHAALMGFAPNGILQNMSDDPKLAELVGLPISNFGFPFESKYHPTGSQVICMSGSLSAPFLVEKISLEFSASFGSEYLNASYFGPTVRQFFLLSWDESAKNDTYEIGEADVRTYWPVNVSVTDGTTGPLIQSGSGNVELIAAGEICMYPRKHVGAFPTVTPLASWSRDLNLDRNYTIDYSYDYYQAVTGTYRVDFSPRAYPAGEATAAHRFASAADRDLIWTAPYLGTSTNSNTEYVGNFWGGRGLNSKASGHSFIRSVTGTELSGSTSLVNYKAPDINVAPSRIATVDAATVRREAPYLLMPNSRIVVGFANTPNIVSNGYQLSPDADADGLFSEAAVAHAKTVLSPGAGKITLYGSFLQNNLPKESETNQPLTSDAVHEDLHYDNPVYDQWDVEPRAALTGSYVDLVITGSMLATNDAGEFGDPWGAPGTRRVVYSVAAGQAGPSGSLQRFVRLDDSTDRFYDANVPEVRSFLNLLGATAEDQSPAGPPFGTHTLFLDARGGVASSQSALDFVRSYPFAGVLSNVRRTQSPEKFLESEVVNGRGHVGKLSAVGYLYKTNDTVSSDTEFVPGATAPGPRQTHQNAIKTLFGFVSTTPTVSGSKVPDIGNANGPTYAAGEVKIRGYKYGLGGLFGASLDARFRRDKYGQFRDMLEPRRYPATLRGNSVDYPVRINFVPQDSQKGGSTTPIRTHSQNLSPFSTSSLPYFDGLTVDRGDNPDETLKPVEIELTVS